MGKKMKKLPFLFKAADTAVSTRPWPGCIDTPTTPSFRANTNASIQKTIDSIKLNDRNSMAQFAETPDSFSSVRDPPEESLPGASEFCSPDRDETAVVGGLRSDRLFFEPGQTSSILEEARGHDFPYKESVALMVMDSRDPFLDFRVSMEEMVEAHGLNDWDGLEELLTCYLRVNEKSNHGYIVGAFEDLLLHLELAPASCSIPAIDERCSSSATTTRHSFISHLSLSSSTHSSISPCLSLLGNEDEIAVQESDVKTSSSFSSGA